MSFLKVQNLPGPGGEGRVFLAWPMDVVEAFCTSADSAELPSEQRVIVAGTGRCAAHVNAPDPCLFAERMPPECPHPVVTRPDGEGLVRCLTCGADSVPVPDNLRRLTSTGAAAPQGPDESFEAIIGDPDADHSSLLTPEGS
jgi:hypothetical protein